MKKTLLIAIALVLALPVASRADSNIHVISTRQLADACKLVADSEHKAFCVGYVSATYETYLVSRHPQVAKDFICHPDPAPRRDEVSSDFVKWSDDHKQFDSAPAADNVLRFLSERFPCKRAS